MKSIVMSFQPKWCAKILNGEKMIEVRTRFPNELPVEVFMACTKETSRKSMLSRCIDKFKNKIMFYCGWLFAKEDKSNILNGKVVGKFTVEKVDVISFDKDYGAWVSSKTGTDCPTIFEKACINYVEFNNYFKKRGGFALHITNLEIFDKPKELSEFRNLNGLPLTRAPQSYCFATLYDVILPKEAE